MTAQQRETLATFGYSSIEANTADFYIDHKTPDTVAEATAESVVAILDGIAQKKADEEAEKKAKLEARVQEWLAKPIGDFVTKDNYGWSKVKTRCDSTYDWEIPADPRLDAKCAEAASLAEWFNSVKRDDDAQKKADRDAIDAAKKAERERGIAVLANWVECFGSELAQARKEDGFEWVGLAEQEYAANLIYSIGLRNEDEETMPEGYELDDEADRNTPTLAEIAFLRELRERAVRRPVTVELRWMKYESAEDADGYDLENEAFGQTEAKVMVTTPTGRKIEFYFSPAKAVLVNS